MNRRSLALTLCSLLLVPAGLVAQSSAPAAPAAAAKPAAPALPTQKVLIHVHSSDPADWKAAVQKANETMSSAKPGTTLVEILATGDGLKLVNKDGALNLDVANSLDKDVSFVACHASMRANHMTVDQLHSGVGTVPSGSREIALRKADGWTVTDDKPAAK